MAIQYLCDVCGQSGQAGATTSATGVPEGWACISVLIPRQKIETAGLPILAVPQPTPIIVCSQACAEKALDNAREALREAFKESGQLPKGWSGPKQ